MLVANAGTVSYCAPELLKEGKLTKAADVYSFAMIMWEMFSGTALFRGMNSSQAGQSVLILMGSVPATLAQAVRLAIRSASAGSVACNGLLACSLSVGHYSAAVL